MQKSVSSQPFRVLTNQTKKGKPYLLQRASLLTGWSQELERRRQSPRRVWYWGDLYWAWKLFSESRRFDAVVTGWEHSALLFAVLQLCFRRRRKCHFILYTNWRTPQSSFLRRLQMVKYQTLSRAVTGFVTLSRRQRELHAQAWSIPQKQFVVLPYHITASPHDVNATVGDYVFAGGDTERDYHTLIEAVKGLRAKTVIAARSRYHFDGIEVPENVEILTTDSAAFFQLMAGARVVVVPLKRGLFRGGEQTFLNAMAMGKPVVVLSDCGADEYIHHSETGIVLESGDAAGLRSALRTLIEDDVLAMQMGQKAAKAAKEFSARRFCDGLFDKVADCARV